MTIKFDLHTHHERCGHATGNVRDYIEAAYAQGFSVIGIADHAPYFYSEQDALRPRVAMGKSEFDGYVAEVLRLQAEYRGKIDVLLGLESDFFPGKMAAYEAAFKRYPFDYIIGSIHAVDGISVFNRNRFKTLTQAEQVGVKDRYYRLIKQSTQSGLFQVLGHIDVMKAFYPAFSDIQSEEVDEALRVAGEMGVAIEVNTSGKTKACGGWYPSNDMLERALYYDVDVTYGSDAHVPERVGDDFAAVQATLKEIGFKQMCYFKQKQKVFVDL